LALTKFKDFDSPSNIYNRGEHQKVREVLSSYIKPEHVTFMINSYKKIEETEKDLQAKSQKKWYSVVTDIYNNYFYELRYALLFSMIQSLCSMISFNSFYLLFAVENKKDADSLQWAKFNSTIMKVWLMVAGIIGMKYKINKFRKRIYVLGLVILTINWFILALFFFNGSYAYSIPMGYVVSTMEATCFMPFYTMILEVCGDQLYTFSISAYAVYNGCIAAVSPWFIQTPENYASYCLGTSFIVCCLAIFGFYFILETQGLEKKDVFDILRKKITREQALENNRIEIAKIKEDQDKKKVD